MLMRRARALRWLWLLLLGLPQLAAPVAGADTPPAAPAPPALPAGAVPALGLHEGGSYLGALRSAAAGSLEPPGILAAGEPAALGPGQVATVLVADVEGDGRDELLQQRTEPEFGLALADGATGAVRWSARLKSEYYLATAVPSTAGPGADLLVLYLTVPDYRFRARLLRGTTGQEAWNRLLPPGLALGYFGLARDGAGWNAVTGVWSGGPDLYELELELRPLADGTRTAGLTLTGLYNLPTVAIAGDLDADAVDDLFVFEPVSAITLGSAGTLRALTRRGQTTAWSTTFALPLADWTFLVAAEDITGDGVPDPVLLTIWIGEVLVVPVTTREVDTIAIVDGRGGDAAGLRPVTSVTLDQFVLAMASPGDLDGDGKRDLVFSGGRLSYGAPSAEQAVVFDAIGARGRLWTETIGITTSGSNFIGAWWPDAGDLNGSGVRDAIVLVGTKDTGWTREVALEQRDASAIWDRAGLEDGLTLATGVDFNGDGRADVVDGFRVSHPRFATQFDFALARGHSLAPLWGHTRTLDVEAFFFLGFAAGRFAGGPGPDLVIDYNQYDRLRHFEECLDGATGQVVWTDPHG